MVLTRAALEKLNKKELISLFVENNDNIANLTNQLAEVNKTSERMKSRLKISKTIKNTLKKHITLEKQSWRNEQYSQHGCVEIVGFLTQIMRQKYVNLLEMLLV